MTQTPKAARRAVVLGPQRHVPIVRAAVDALAKNPQGPIAFVSAGWEERESEDGEFREHVQRPVRNLEIWGRVERIFAKDPELLTAMRQRHDALRRTQELYRIRLEGIVRSMRELIAHIGDADFVQPELDGAFSMLRELDREHTSRIAALHREFDGRVRPGDRPSVREHAEEIAEQLEGAEALCVAGGHVGVLLHRMQLFDLVRLWGDRPIVAWSAGAMALSQRVVLFHHGHSLSQNGVDTEVMEQGLSALPGIVPLPHGKKRLDLHDEKSLQLLARRFAPDPCVLLDDGDRLDWDGSAWKPQPGTRTIDDKGRVAEARA